MASIPQNFTITLKTQPPVRDDADRLIQIGGEAVTAARRAVAALDELDPPVDRANPKLFSDLRRLVDRREILTPVFRNRAEAAVVLIDSWRIAHDDDGDATAASDLFEKAIERSELVADYRAAETVVGARQVARSAS